MSIQVRSLPFVYALWDSVQDKIVGLTDEQGDRTYFPYWNPTQTALVDPQGNAAGVTGGSFDAALQRSAHVGVPTLLVTAKTDSFTPALAELLGGDNLFLANKATALTVTLPAEATLAIPVNTKFSVMKVGAGDLIIAVGAGATVLSSISLTATVLNARYECWKIGPNLWNVTADSVGAAVGAPPPPASSPQFTTAPEITTLSVPIYPGMELSMSDGVTNVTTTKVKQWWFLDASGFSAQIVQAGVGVTGNTYTPTDQDIDNTVFGKVIATPSFGAAITQTVPGFPVIRPATTPAPSPPPSPGTTRGLTIPQSSLIVSSPITAVSNQIISGKDFGTGPGVKITIPQGVTGVTVENCRFASSDGSALLCQGGSTIIRNNLIPNGYRGILLNSATNTTVQYNRFEGCSLGTQFDGHAFENDFNTGPTIFDSNDVLGTYNTDAVSNFSTSQVTFTNNNINVNITLTSGAAFTMGDSLNNTPGRDNYIAFNTVIQTGIGVAPGIFGSDGNTVMEYNCFTNAIQCYEYNGNPLLGVTIRYNVIAPGYFVPRPELISQWNTNIIGTDCTQVPSP